LNLVKFERYLTRDQVKS